MISLLEAVESGGIGLFMSITGSYVYSVFEGARSLDKTWHDDSEKLSKELQRQTERGDRLDSQLADSLRPKRSEFEEREFQDIKSKVDRYGEDERTVLRHLLRHHAMTEDTMYSLYPLPDGFSRDRTVNAFNVLVCEHICVRRFSQNLGNHATSLEITPGAIPHLIQLL